MDTELPSLMNLELALTWSHSPVSHLGDNAPGVISTLSDLSIASQMLHNDIINLQQGALIKFESTPYNISRLHHCARLSALEAVLITIPVAKDESSQRLRAMVKIDHVMSNILISLFPNFDEMRCNTYVPLFERLLDLCLIILQFDEAERKQRKGTHVSPSSQIIKALFVTGLRCRDPKLRRRAIGMLQQYPRREGIWHSKLSAAIITNVLEIEETGAMWSDGWRDKTANDLPYEARVRAIDTHHITDKRVRVTFRTQAQLSAGHSGITKEITW